VSLIGVVVSAVPFQRMLAPLTAKDVPLTTMVKAGCTAAMDGGLRLLMVGAGAVRVKETVLELFSLLGVLTIIVPEPGVSIRLAGITAVSCVGLT